MKAEEIIAQRARDDLAKALGKMTVHPVADLFPLLEDVKMEELQNSVSDHGLIEPILRQGNVVLDGRNRLVACYRAKVEPRFEEYAGDAPARHIYETNFRRRHLTEDQLLALGTRACPHLQDEAKARLKGTQFKAGNPGDPSKWKADAANTKSSSPRKRDIKQMHARSTAGMLATLANVSGYKAGKAIAVAKAEEAGEIEKGTIDSIMAGTITFADAVSKLQKNKPTKKRKSKVKTITERCEAAWAAFMKNFRDEERSQVLEWLGRQLL